MLPPPCLNYIVWQTNQVQCFDFPAPKISKKDDSFCLKSNLKPVPSSANSNNSNNSKTKVKTNSGFGKLKSRFHFQINFHR